MVKPYNNNESKKYEVRAMFDNIARNYDFLNHFLSFGIDILWRKRLIRTLKKYRPKSILDIATGTGDLAIMAIKTGADNILGVDISTQMIEVGNQKIKKRSLDQKVRLTEGDAESLNFEDESFDAAMVAFGVRNFEDLEKGLFEINRVLKPNAPFCVLEFSKPQHFPVKQLYGFYSYYLLPKIGRLISNDKRAYTYLPESISEFPHGDGFLEILKKCNFENTRLKRLSFGIATLYIGEKVCAEKQ
ncbi:MAG TPA: bifunctional demethylmenaquinone methyltransferase/2-methoxy-6-polyprenyl-1,4-benzoquinol methylase UbiE [Prolixibacteraceae bacterium]|nr:bifunctional demethylmenaquinone methyltransferase/2-methoxy-6-polyprenyl-1,4-benzoquinol methylase UbiE [Prolixibacteraceae bacterium]HPR61741.1 bifunctional demethylmenaquinone methyltransferase/2-methoxy-6-polyprenyl-1,4-benzoquinol methylase UbiE [Prolixibacteraceae bacterium]